MANLTTLDTTAGIYETEATIRRHKDGSVTIRAPFVKWTRDVGALAFTKVHIKGAEASETARKIFSDNPPIVTQYGDTYTLGYAEFISDYI